jgi:drug/metabolite transporter (DMT)-like permease
MNLKTVTSLILLGMIWGSSFLFQRITVPVIGAGVTASGRVVLAALALLALVIATGRQVNFRARWRNYVALGFFSAGVPFLLFAYAAHYLPAGYSAVLNATVPMFTVLLGWLAGPRPSASKLAGVVVGLVGVATLVRFGTVALSWATVAAFIGLLVASLMYAIGARMARERFAGVDPLVMACGSMLGALLPQLPFAVATAPTVLPSLGVVAALVVLGVVCTGLAYAIFYQLIRDAGSEKAVTVTLIVPIFAQIWGALFLGEAITWASALGCALVLFAVALIFERVPGLKPRAIVPAVLCDSKAA